MGYCPRKPVRDFFDQNGVLVAIIVLLVILAIVFGGFFDNDRPRHEDHCD